MSRSTKLRVLCYDISCDRRRRKIAKLLEEHASRVQYSVFETRLSKNALNRIVAQSLSLLSEDDSLRVYTIGKSGERQSQVLGSGAPIEAEAGFWLL